MCVCVCVCGFLQVMAGSCSVFDGAASCDVLPTALIIVVNRESDGIITYSVYVGQIVRPSSGLSLSIFCHLIGNLYELIREHMLQVYSR